MDEGWDPLPPPLDAYGLAPPSPPPMGCPPPLWLWVWGWKGWDLDGRRVLIILFETLSERYARIPPTPGMPMRKF